MKTVEGSRPDPGELGANGDHILADLEDFLKPGRMIREWYHPRLKKWLVFQEPLAEEMAAIHTDIGIDILFCGNEAHGKRYNELMFMISNGVKVTNEDVQFLQHYGRASKNYVPKLLAALSSEPKLTVDATINLIRGLTSREINDLAGRVMPLLLTSDEWSNLKNSSAPSAASSMPTSGSGDSETSSGSVPASG